MRPDYITGPYIQRGKGFGSIFSSLFRNVVPALKSLGKKIFSSQATKDLVKSAKKTSIKRGANFVADVLEGKDAKLSAKKAFGDAKKDFATDVRKVVNKKGKRKRNIQSSIPKKKYRKLREQTLFDN